MSSEAHPMDPAEAFATLSRVRIDEIDLDVLLDQIAYLAQRAVPGADEVSVTLVRSDAAYTAAFTGEVAVQLDESQYEQGHGPCLDASASASTLSLPDIATEPRWPEWAKRARDAGIRSSLSIGLPVQDKVTGALNVYATGPGAFDADGIALAQTFAGYAAVALANVHLYHAKSTLAAHMQKAMESRAVIEQAKGIIMGERRCTPDEAFRILTKISQDTNRKLRDVATLLVSRASRIG